MRKGQRTLDPGKRLSKRVLAHNVTFDCFALYLRSTSCKHVEARKLCVDNSLGHARHVLLKLRCTRHRGSCAYPWSRVSLVDACNDGLALRSKCLLLAEMSQFSGRYLRLGVLPPKTCFLGEQPRKRGGLGQWSGASHLNTPDSPRDV